MSLNNLGDLSGDLGIRLSEPTASYWTESERYSWLNQGQVDVARRTKCLQTDGKITTVEDTYDYLTSAISSNFLLPVWAKIYDSGTAEWLDLTYHDNHWLNLYHPSWRNADSGTPQWYWHDKASQTVYLHPKPSSVYAGTEYLWLGYAHKPTEMVNLSDVPQIPLEYRELPILYALARAFWKRGKHTVGDKYNLSYLQGVAEMTIDLRDQPNESEVVRPYRS